jgi:hypothetical protein
MSYKFKYKRKFFWRSVVVIGHGYDTAQDKMVLYKPDGSIQEISHWRDCECKLGVDWKLAQQKAMEDKAGVSIPLKV